MPHTPFDVTNIAAIDAVLNKWQQGDAVIGAAFPFVHVADLSLPLTSASRAEAAAGVVGGVNLTTIGTPTPGFVVVAQTCDLVRSCTNFPLAQIACLRELDQKVT